MNYAGTSGECFLKIHLNLGNSRIFEDVTFLLWIALIIINGNNLLTDETSLN